MSKKYLKLFQEPLVVDKCSSEDKKSIYLTARKCKNILEVAVFVKEKAKYRIFFEGDDFMTYITGEDRFSKKSIYDLDYYLSGHDVYCDDKSKALLLKYLHGAVEEKSLLDLISDHQWSIKRKRLEKKHRSEEEMLDEKMKIFRKPVPRGYENFVRNKVFSEDFVLFYCRKEDYAYCTKCGTWHKYSEMEDKPKIGKNIVCPCCRSTVKCRARVPQNGQTVCKWSLLVQTDGDRVLFRYFCHSLTIKGTEIGEIRTSEMQRSINDVFGTKSYMWDSFHNTGKMRWCNYHDPTGSFNPSMWTYPTKGIYVYQRGLEKVLEVERYRYSAFDLYCRPVFFSTSYGPENYLYQYLKKPYIEKLIKVRFHKMASYLLDSWYGERMEKELNRSASDVKGLLNVDGRTYKRLVMIGDPSVEDYRVLKEFSFLNERNLKRIKNVPKVAIRIQKIKRAMSMDGMTHTKFISYVEKNCLNDIDLYLDYLDFCIFLGYPATSEYLYPKDLKAMHSKFAEEKAVIMEQKRREELERKSREMALLTAKMEKEARYHMEDDSYVIVLPKDYESLRMESQVLNHCVKTYIDDINKGQTMIFFIRKREEVEKPFFTLEINKDLNLVQCRTRHNKKAVEFDREKGTHVQNFAESFRRQLVNAAFAS